MKLTYLEKIKNRNYIKQKYIEINNIYNHKVARIHIRNWINSTRYYKKNILVIKKMNIRFYINRWNIEVNYLVKKCS